MIINTVRIKVTFSVRREVYWFTNSEVSLVKSETDPTHREQGETIKEANHSLMVGGRFNKPENLHMRLILGNCKDERFLYPPTRI